MMNSRLLQAYIIGWAYLLRHYANINGGIAYHMGLKFSYGTGYGHFDFWLLALVYTAPCLLVWAAQRWRGAGEWLSIRPPDSHERV